MEGFGNVSKTNVKLTWITRFIFAAVVCCAVNLYIYHEMLFDCFPLQLFNLNAKYRSNAPTINTFRKNIFAEMKDIQKTSRNIFFLETRCSTNGGMKDYLNNTGFILNARQCCSIESTAVMNFDRPVYVFHSCPISEDFLTHSPKFVVKLFNYSNIYVVRLHTSEVFNDTPLQELYEKRLLESSLHPIEHSTDVMRLLFLWKFGGTYCDLDVVTIRSFHTLNSNWAGSQDDAIINNAVINVEPDGVGHDLMLKVMEHVNNHFDGSQWDGNGPFMVTPFILNECKANTVPQAVELCNGSFTVLPCDAFYPVNFHLYESLFKEDLGRQVVDQVKSSAFSVHIWNKLSHDAVVHVNSTQAYALLASEFCPAVYQNSEGTF